MVAVRSPHLGAAAAAVGALVGSASRAVMIPVVTQTWKGLT